MAELVTWPLEVLVLLLHWLIFLQLHCNTAVTYCSTPRAAVPFLVKLCNLKNVFTLDKASFERLRMTLERLCLGREIIFYKFPNVNGY